MDELATLLRSAGANVAWIIAAQLALALSGLASAIGRAWLRGDIVHKREVERLTEDHARELKRLGDELAEVKADRTRWMQMAWQKDQTNAVAVQTSAVAVKALAEHAGETPI